MTVLVNASLEVPVIAVFTKYDQFLRNVEMHVADYPHEYPNSSVSEVAEKLFQELYLHPLGDDIRYVRLESGFRVKYLAQRQADFLWQRCTRKIRAVITSLRRQPQH